MSFPCCPQCGVEVGSTWRWCLACGYDPDGAAHRIRADAHEARRRKANWVPTIVVVVGLALGAGFLWTTTPSNGSVGPVTTISAAPVWQPFAPAQAGFVVDMPAAPQLRTGTFSPTGTPTKAWAAGAGGGRVVTVTELDTGRPELEAGVPSELAQQVLKNVVNQIAAISNGTVEDMRSTYVGPSEALDYTIEGASLGRQRGRLVLAGRFVYMLAVTAPEPDPAIEDRFFSSFSFT